MDSLNKCLNCIAQPSLYSLEQAIALASAALRGKIADTRAVDRLEAIKDVRDGGATSLRAIAAALNERGIPTPTHKGEWSAMQVQRILARAGKPRKAPKSALADRTVDA